MTYDSFSVLPVYSLEINVNVCNGAVKTCSHIRVYNTLTQDMNLLLQLSVYSEMGYKCSSGYIQIVQHLGGYILCVYVLPR